MPGTAGTVQPLDWAFTWNVFYAEQVNTSREPEPGPSCMQAGPALRNFAGEHFPLLTSRLCVFNLLAVLRFGFRHDGRHAHILTLQGFDHHFSGSVPSKVLWLYWVLAQVLDTLKVCNPFVHKLSWPSTWNWQHFGNHLSCPCATCALNLAWFDCHFYHRGMNRYRSPRVIAVYPIVISKLKSGIRSTPHLFWKPKKHMGGYKFHVVKRHISRKFLALPPSNIPGLKGGELIKQDILPTSLFFTNEIEVPRGFAKRGAGRLCFSRLVSQPILQWSPAMQWITVWANITLTVRDLQAPKTNRSGIAKIQHLGRWPSGILWQSKMACWKIQHLGRWFSQQKSIHLVRGVPGRPSLTTGG